MMRKMFAGSTAETLPFFAQNSSTGGGLGSLTYATGGLVCEYRRKGAATWTAVTLAAGTLGTWSSGGFVADGGLAGAYELGIPNAALAAGAEWVEVRLYGAASMAPVLFFIELDAVNYQLPDLGLGSVALPTAPVANSWGEALFLADLAGGRVNVAQGGTSTTVTLDTGASADAGAYVGDDIYLYSGTGGGVRGTGQRRTVTAYNQTTKVATVQRAWDTNPAAGTGFITLPQPQANVGLWGGVPTSAPPTAAQVATAVWQDTTAGDFETAASIGLSLFTGIAPGASGGHFLAGTNAAAATGPVTLAATGLNAIPITDPGGIAGMTSLPALIVALWRYQYKQTTLSATQLATYADNGSTINVTMNVSDNGVLQTKGAAN